MEITLKLTVDQVNAILSAIGEMPVKSGLGGLAAIIIEQARPQIPEEQQEEQTDKSE